MLSEECVPTNCGIPHSPERGRGWSSVDLCTPLGGFQAHRPLPPPFLAVCPPVLALFLCLNSSLLSRVYFLCPASPSLGRATLQPTLLPSEASGDKDTGAGLGLWNLYFLSPVMALERNASPKVVFGIRSYANVPMPLCQALAAL